MKKVKLKITEYLKRFARYILRDELEYYQERDNCSRNKINIPLSLFIAILKQLPDANNFGAGTTTADELRGGKEFCVLDELGLRIIKLRFKRVTKNTISIEAPEYCLELEIPLKHITLNFSDEVQLTTFSWDIANCNVGCVLDRRSELAMKQFITALQEISAC